MNPVTVEQSIDVTLIPARQKHPAILKAWDDLHPGGAILLVNDHDPLPLYYQFSCEYAGMFQWKYLERGPASWRVRIRKGDFPDPGFVPARKPASSAAPAIPGAPASPHILDTRPLFERGETPCDAIDEAVASLHPGQPLILLVPFEPVPLYAKLGREGFSHHASQRPDGVWQVEFRRESEPA
jgi:uncharacterized protein (DUF2249 family)